MTTLTLTNAQIGERLYVAIELHVNTTIKAKDKGSILSDGVLTGPVGHLVCSGVVPMTKIKDAEEACRKNYHGKDPSVKTPPKTEDEFYQFYFDCLIGMNESADPLYWLDRLYNGVRLVFDGAGLTPEDARDEIAAAAYIYLPSRVAIDVLNCKIAGAAPEAFAKSRVETLSPELKNAWNLF